MNLNGLERFTSKDVKLIEKAYNYAVKKHENQFRKSGEPYIIHPIAVAQILIDCKQDVYTVCAGLLHDVVEDTNTPLSEIVKEFGGKIANIVDGVTKITNFPEGDLTKEVLEQKTIRKFVASCVNDIRIIIVKLADRLHNMRTLQYMSDDKKKEKSFETLKVYVPIARLIGAFRIANELSDLAFKYAYPDYYQTLLGERNLLLTRYDPILKEMIYEIQERLNQKHIPNEIRKKIKNLYGIYLNLKGDPNIMNMNDLLGIKVLVPTEDMCYLTLRVVDKAYPNVPYTINDYISSPKPNGYQSLHSVVLSPKKENVDSHFVHVRIRTQEMENVAVYGISPCTYEKDDQYKKKIFPFLMGLNNENLSDRTFYENLLNDVFSKKIYVQTPKGELRELPAGATVVDFAYGIHTDLGNTLSQAFVNGKLVSPLYELKNNDLVEIVTSADAIPDFHWSTEAKTALARTKVRKYYEKGLRE